VGEHFKTAEEIPQEMIKRKAILKGYATRIMDGDTFKFYHSVGNQTPPSSIQQLKEETFSVRLAGIDTPETPKQGKPGQPFGKEACEYLTSMIHKKEVTIQLQSRDQYHRVVAIVMCNGKDASVEMLRNGFAHIYEGKGGSFGNKESEMRQCCEQAKQARKGLWSQSNVQTPSEYKKNHQ
jgi:endonuclease YncB( thermonuclease family)